MNRQRSFSIMFSIFIVLFFCQAAFAVYTWVDEKGNVHVSDFPRPLSPKEQKDLEKAASEKAASEQPAPVPPAPAPEELKPVAAPQTAVTPTVKPAVASPAPLSAATQTKPAPVSAAVTTAQARPAPVSTAQTATQTLATQATPTPAPPAKEEPKAPAPAAPHAAPANAIAAFIAGFLVVFLVMIVGAYVYFSLCLFLIAKKLGIPHAWAAWVPILQVWPLLSSAGKPCWWVLLLFIPLLNVFIGVYLWICITENLGRNKWLGLLMLLPVFNFVWMGILAFSKGEAEPAASAE